MYASNAARLFLSDRAVPIIESCRNQRTTPAAAVGTILSAPCATIDASPTVFEFPYKTEAESADVQDVKALGAGLPSDRMSDSLSDNEDEWNGHVLRASPTEL